jgi:hypothetical protein
MSYEQRIAQRLQEDIVATYSDVLKSSQKPKTRKSSPKGAKVLCQQHGLQEILAHNHEAGTLWLACLCIREK